MKAELTAIIEKATEGGYWAFIINWFDKFMLSLV